MFDEYIDLFFDLAGIMVFVMSTLFSFKMLTKSKTKLTLPKLALIILILLLIYFNGTYNYSFSKTFVYLFLIIILNYTMYNLNFYDTTITTTYYYIFIIMCELIFTIILLNINNLEIEQFDQNHILKFVFTLLVYLSGIFCLLLPFMKKVYSKVYKLASSYKSGIINVILCLLTVLLSSLIYKFIIDISILNYIFNIIIILIVAIFITLLINQNLKNIKAREKETILLNFMSEYEKIIDESNINRHEMLNNLLILKSIPKKCTKEYDEALNELISKYDKNSNSNYVKLYELPSGFKGLLYYKIYGMKSKNINVELNISKKIKRELEKIESKKFLDIYKLLGILLDNASEAANDSKDKCVIIDIYVFKETLNFYVANTFNQMPKIELINKKKYSSKGKSRGYGLYIAKQITERNSDISLNQQILDSRLFESTIIVKKTEN